MMCLALPFVLFMLVSNPIFMRMGLIEFAFAYGVLRLAKVFMVTPFSKKAGGVHLMVVLFCSVLAFNVLGLFPFIAGGSMSAAVVCSFGFVFWVCGTIGGLFSSGGFLKGMWVKGAPISLNFVVIFSELLSWFARPFVLMLRLLANIFCGHLIMAILAELSMSLVWEGHWLAISLSVVGGWCIGLMEWAVMLIQTIIFVGLIGWSWSENPKAPRSFFFNFYTFF
uniref:ATP synthase F0 subunit 6 n=1 Tax=Mimachlamys varia TaxID=50417 RepID=UPI001FA79CD9|nr:ATP synthase F0 subunit 6 [Mimachlamys varia]UNA71550.1 ATP synthase subunit 6 [Mimachlamys varia]